MPTASPRNTIAPEVDFFNGEPMANAFRMAYREFKRLLSLPEIKSAAALVGLPGAGKSSYCDGNECPEIAFFDALSARPGARKALIGMANKAGKPIDAIWLTTAPHICINRNLRRDPKRQVPPAAIMRAHKNLMRFPPRTGEGFRRIIKVDGYVDK